MSHRIDRDALVEFVDAQINLVEGTPPTDLILAITGTLDEDGLALTWLAAGIATQIGLALMDEPERFITTATAVPS